MRNIAVASEVPVARERLGTGLLRSRFAALLIPSAVLGVGGRLQPWVFMWLLAATIYATFKWFTFVEAVADGARPTPARSVAYLLGWPGMDAHAFFGPPSPTAVSWGECAAALAKTFLGAGLLWGGARVAAPYGAFAAGWTGLVGLIFLLHFGIFHLLSAAWRGVGINARPIMRNPVAATSISDLWGRRWNLAFHVLARDLVVKPFRSRIGISAATFLAFTFSGLIHDLVISIPARGGYGLPTAYFLVQGAALLLERSSLGAALGLRGGWNGRIFAIIVVAGPAFWLFHPVFVQAVVLPFLRAIGAL